MPGSVVFDTAVGLVFVFLTASLICSAAVEWLANKMNKRGEYLLRGLRELLDIPPATPHAPDSGGDSRVADKQDLLEQRDTRECLQKLSTLGQALPGQPAEGEPHILEKVHLADLVLAHPTIASLHRPGRPGRTQKETLAGRLMNRRAKKMHLASYISARAFARSLIDLLSPQGSGGKTMVGELKGLVEKLPDTLPAKAALRTLLRDAGDDLDRFRRSLEQWYDEHMGRVSGWYKRWSQWRLFVAGVALALVMNVNSIAIGRALYEDEPLRNSVVAQALSANGCPDASEAAQEECLRGQVDVLRNLSVPLGWDVGGAATACREFNEGHDCLPNVGRWLPYWWSEAADQGFGRTLLTPMGWLLTAAAVSFGAPFWFDALSKLGSLRTAGRRPGENEPYEPDPRDSGAAPIPPQPVTVQPQLVAPPPRRWRQPR
jgi:hypothetical protein